jgi:hypothetical protein
MTMPSNDIENPLKNRNFIDDEDMKALIDEYFRRNPDVELMNELQSLIEAHKGNQVEEAAATYDYN